MEPDDFVADIFKKTTEYLKEFNNQTINCKSTSEYFALVVSVMTFKNLVISSLEKQMIQGSTMELNDILQMLNKKAEEFAAEIEKTSLEVDKTLN